MKIFVIEDESRAANRIIRLLTELLPDSVIAGQAESIAESLDFLNDNSPDLIVSDIQLADGMSFEIFKSHPISCPIIFTTAYDQFAIQAFETNGIDYLLKPIEKERLNQALQKLEQFKQKIDIDELIAMASRISKPSFKSRFMIKVGDKIKSIPVTDISLFYSLDKGTFIHTAEHRNYVIDQSLEDLKSLIDPIQFFRISRKYIVSIDCEMEIFAHSNSRIRLKIKDFDDQEVVVARERVKEFKAWLDR